jgi:endonuclease YncB( thermonuclease family)
MRFSILAAFYGMKLTKGFSSLFIFSLFFFSYVFATDFPAKVVGVSDGDSITVLKEKQQIKIRLAHIDCPENKQAFSSQAKKFTSDLVFGKDVKVIPTAKDRYGRTFAVVVLSDGRVLNKEIVKAGFGWWYFKYSEDQQYRKLEDVARSEKRGLWVDANAIAPWEYREKGIKNTQVSN